jgi:hypothetical protein
MHVVALLVCAIDTFRHYYITIRLYAFDNLDANIIRFLLLRLLRLMAPCHIFYDKLRLKSAI